MSDSAKLTNAKDIEKFTEKCKELSLATLTTYIDQAQVEYAPIHRRFSVLDAVEKGKLWQAIRAKFPKYQILPDTNLVSYIASNIVASIYTVAKVASILPTSQEDKDLIVNANVALEHIWDTRDVPYYQLKAGTNAALFNIGITQIGWSTAEDGIVLKDISPLKYMRDPFAASLDDAQYVFLWEDYHKTVILNTPEYADSYRKFLARNTNTTHPGTPTVPFNDRADANRQQDYHRIYTCFIRYIDTTGDEPVAKLAEVHILNKDAILYINTDVRPNVFPVVELYCNLPRNDLIGASEPSKILSNNIAYNLLSSIRMTAEYKNQRPPKFISSQSGLNISNFSKHGNDSDYTFIVNGDASRAVHYHQFPFPSPTAPSLQDQTIRDIQFITGVDERYTGRDTGSVLTTGGIEDMLSRVTVIDTPKIKNYERYTLELTKIIIQYYKQFGGTRTYLRKDPIESTLKTVSVSFGSLKMEALQKYALNISSELPKTKQRVAAMANQLVEKQMQYGTEGPELITPEEWLMMQDLPNKEFMLKRMNVQRMSDLFGETAQTIFSYANFVANGFPPDEALAATAQNLEATRRGETPPVEVPPYMPPEEVMPMEQPMDLGMDMGAPLTMDTGVPVEEELLI